MKDFKVHILGVLKNVQAPQRNLILARLEGGPLAETGVIAGMSGSPVYVDGRLDRRGLLFDRRVSEGADRRHHPDRRDDRSDGRHVGTRRGERAAGADRAAGHAGAPGRPRIRATYARIAAFADRPADVQAFGLPGVSRLADGRAAPSDRHAAGDERHGRRRRPISCRRCSATPGSRRCSSGGAVGRRAAGDRAAAARAIRSASRCSAATARWAPPGRSRTSTATRVYAFGHPFFNFGPTAFPMTRAHGLHLAAQPDVVVQDRDDGRSDRDDAAGSRDGDRRHARQGPGDDSDHHHARHRRADRSARSATPPSNDQLFTPLLTYVALFNTLGNYERQFGATTFTVKGKATFDKHADLAYEDIFTGDGTIPAASAYVAGPITMLLANDLEPVTAEGGRARDHDVGGIALGHDRARLARRRAAARRAHRAAEGADAQLPRQRRRSRPSRSRSRPTPPAS